MELSPYVEGLRRELATLTRLAPAEVVALAEQLADALDSSIRLTLLNALTAAAAEISQDLDATVIDVRLNDGEPEFIVTTVTSPPAGPAQAPPADAGPDDSGTARITLRVSESIKARIEARAAAAGISVNGWLAHAVIRALEDAEPGARAGAQRSRLGVGQRITGYARS
jgi:hypothetical protein